MSEEYQRMPLIGDKAPAFTAVDYPGQYQIP